MGGRVPRAACVLFAGILGVTAGCVDLGAPPLTPGKDAAVPDAMADSGSDDFPTESSDDGLPLIDAADDSPAAPVAGPIAHWRLDEARGTTFEDQTPNTGSGWALNGTLWTTADLAVTLGPENRAALRFDGINDYAIVGVAGLPANGGAFTISLWINAVATTAPQNLVHLTDGLRRGLQLVLRADTLVALDGDNQPLVSTATPAAGAWHHVAYSYDEVRSRVFVDGELKATLKTLPPLGPVLEGWLASNRGRSAFFNGVMDDIRIYNRALPDAELADIAAGAAAPEPSGGSDAGADAAVGTDGPTLPVIPDLVAYWKLDESIPGARAVDSTGNGHTAAPANAPTPSSPAPGLAFVNPRSLSFNTSNTVINQCSLVTSSPRLNFTGQITMAAWIKPAVAIGPRQIMGHGSGNPETGMRVENNTFVVYSRNTTAHLTSFAMPREDLNQWVHLVGTHDGTTWRLYRNGRQVAVTEDDIGALASNGYWSLASGSNCDGAFFLGNLDDVRLFRRALTPTEVRQLAEGAEY